jgi:multiple sugar transport system substrate-binding protein
MRKTRRYLAAATAAFMAMTMIAPAAVSADDAEKITITLAIDEGVGTPTEEAIAAFNESQDEIVVEGYHLPQDANNLHDDFVNKMIAQDTSVDVMALDVVYVAEFASAGWLEPLDDVFTEEELSAYLDGTVAGAKYEDVLYAAPWFTNASALFYRTDVLADLGIEEVPTTFQGWIDIYEQLPEDSGIEYAFCYQASQSEAMVCNWVEFLASYGASVLDDAGAPVVNSPEAIEATTAMRDYIGTYAPEGTTTYAETESQQVFQEGKALTCRTWSGTWNTFNDEAQSKVAGNVGMTVLPVNEEGETAHSCLGGLDLCINVNIDDAKKEAAKTFIKWMISEEEEKAFCLASSQPPTCKAVYTDEEVLEKIPFYTDFYSIIENGKGRPSSPSYAELSDAIQRNVHMALTGETEVEEALNNLQSEAEALQ